MSVSSSDVSPPPLKRRRLSQPVLLSPPSAAASASTTTTAVTPAIQALRIFSWNVNGIAPFLPASTPEITTFLTSPPKVQPPLRPSLRACLRRWSWPHIVGLQEVKIASKDARTQSAVQHIVNTQLDSDDGTREDTTLYNAHFCLPRDKYNGTGFGGKVYGVCMLLRRDLESVHVRTVDWDLEGRIILCEISSQRLVVFNVYAVNGTNYDYRDPQSGKVVGNRHNRKRDFHTLLSNEVRQYETKGWNVIVAGDMNISRTRIDSFPQLRMGDDHVKNRADFEVKFMQELCMIDTFRYINDNERKYTYRPTGRPWGSGGDRVDMCLASKDLASRLEEADILDSEAERGPSDHVPLYVILSGVVLPT